MNYGNVNYNGVVVNGKWKVGDRIYNTPSQAASGEAYTKAGKRTMLNGWKYWNVRRPTDAAWILIDHLRKGKA